MRSSRDGDPVVADGVSVFAALLGDERHGRWRIAPAGDVQRVERRYQPGTLVLETDFETAEGAVRITDCMPLSETATEVARVVEGLRGSVPMTMELILRFDYGRVIPWVRRVGGALIAVAGPDAALAARALSEEGEGFAIGCSFGLAELPSDTVRADQALLLADQRMYEQKASGRVAPSRQSADVLLRLLAERSTELGQHTNDVADLAERTASRLGLAPDEIERVRLAAELHDVGKAAIPDAILNKPGPLDDDEWAFIKRHTVIGERIVRAAPSLACTAELVRSHHERHDGAGYPDALAADAIPVGARIIAVSDAFDAMVSDRPYQQGIAREAALEELRRCAVSQFDPAVVDAFIVVVADRAHSPRP